MKQKNWEQASLGELWFLSYPLIVTMAAQVVMQFVDRMFLARYSHDALAACVPGGVLAMTFGAMFMGLASYTSVFISQYYAQKKICLCFHFSLARDFVGGLFFAGAGLFDSGGGMDYPPV